MVEIRSEGVSVTLTADINKLLFKLNLFITIISLKKVSYKHYLSNYKYITRIVNV